MSASVKEVLGVIPARYNSVRFPGKPLAMIGERSMIQCVYEACRPSCEIDRLLVATDDERIYNHVLEFGGEAVMTGAELATGTDRCYAAARQFDPELVVNIQGDEPLIQPEVIDAVVRSLRSSAAAVCATPIRRMSDQEEINSENVVKVVVNRNLEALYFSRSPVPFPRNSERAAYYKHIGLYAYRFDFMEKYTALKQTELELAESLEQLRILENGYTIQCAPVDYDSIGVDTPEDLERVKKIISKSGKP